MPSNTKEIVGGKPLLRLAVVCTCLVGGETPWGQPGANPWREGRSLVPCIEGIFRLSTEACQLACSAEHVEGTGKTRESGWGEEVRRRGICAEILKINGKKNQQGARCHKLLWDLGKVPTFFLNEAEIHWNLWVKEQQGLTYTLKATLPAALIIQSEPHVLVHS